MKRIILALALILALCGPVHAYDSLLANGDGTVTYTMTAATTDGRIRGVDGAWALARTATDTIADNEVSSDYTTGAFNHASEYYVYRSWIPFSLTGIFGTCTAANYIFKSLSANGGAGPQEVFQQGTATLPLDAADVNAYTGGEIASRMALTTWLADVTHTVPLNATGIAALTVAMNGTFQVCIRADEDFDNSTPPTDGPHVYAGMYYADNATDKPRLVVTVHPVLSDLFDDASINPKWTTGDYVAGAGTVTESGGFFNLNWPASGLAYPYAVYPNGIASQTFDMRIAVNLDAALVNSQGVNLYAMEDYTTALNFCSISYYKSAGVWYVGRTDYVAGVSSSGAQVNIGDQRLVYLRMVGDGDGTFTGYYKLTVGDEWTLLAEPASPWATAELAFDAMMVGTQDVSGGGAAKIDWIVDNADYPDWPLPSGQQVINFF